MTEVANTVALLSLSILFGSIVFFSAGTAPVIFRQLDEASAGRFLRALFPRYYLVLLFTALVAALGFALTRPLDAAIMALVALGAIVSRQGLMPRINAARDRMLAGDEISGRRFKQLHRASVAINLLQLVAALVVLVRLAGSL